MQYEISRYYEQKENEVKSYLEGGKFPHLSKLFE